MSESHRQHRTGAALVIAAATAWSTAAFFTRLLHFDSWTILFWRGLFGGGSITAFLVLTEGWAGIRSLIGMKGNGWLVACLSALGMVTFIPALQLTSVANVAIIFAVQPFAAAAIAWIWLREIVLPRTLVASARRSGDHCERFRRRNGLQRDRISLHHDVCNCDDDSGYSQT
jgi:drug/metabolite transporter (DMT)-like permease